MKSIATCLVWIVAAIALIFVQPIALAITLVVGAVVMPCVVVREVWKNYLR